MHARLLPVQKRFQNCLHNHTANWFDCYVIVHRLDHIAEWFNCYVTIHRL